MIESMTDWAFSWPISGNLDNDQLLSAVSVCFIRGIETHFV